MFYDLLYQVTDSNHRLVRYGGWGIANPVNTRYSDGTSCADAAIKGILHLYIPRVRVTALPGFSNNYKQASTTSLTFAAMDPKLGSKSMYDLVFEPMDSDGNIVTKSSVATGSVGWITSIAGQAAAASA